MVKPDVIVTWPKNCDYPLWRLFMQENRHRFDKVFIVFMETNQGDDYRHFVQTVMGSDYTFLQSPVLTDGQDWRNVAINHALPLSKSDWVWFTEQDFYVEKFEFWGEVDRAINEGCEAVAVLEGQRIHPCSLFVKRTAIERTKKDFSVLHGVHDHFGEFVKNLQHTIDKMGAVDGSLWEHYNGLSHNWTQVSKFEKPPYKPDIFIEYLMRCISAKVELDTRFQNIAVKAIDAYYRKAGIPSSAPITNPKP